MNSQEQANLTPVKEIFDVLFTLLENLETENTAILELLDAEGIATEEKLAPYLERAGNGASVKWRAARARMEHLFSPSPGAVRDTKDETESRKQSDPALDNKNDQAASETPDVDAAGKNAAAAGSASGRSPNTDARANKETHSEQNAATQEKSGEQSHGSQVKDTKQSKAEGKPAAGSGENEPGKTAPAEVLFGVAVGPGAASTAASSPKRNAGDAAGHEGADSQAKKEVRT
jgi:hypothetical protein